MIGTTHDEAVYATQKLIETATAIEEKLAEAPPPPELSNKPYLDAVVDRSVHADILQFYINIANHWLRHLQNYVEWLRVPPPPQKEKTGKKKRKKVQ